MVQGLSLECAPVTSGPAPGIGSVQFFAFMKISANVIPLDSRLSLRVGVNMLLQHDMAQGGSEKLRMHSRGGSSEDVDAKGAIGTIV